MSLPESLDLRWEAYRPRKPWGLHDLVSGKVFKVFDTADGACEWLLNNGYADPCAIHPDPANWNEVEKEVTS